MDHDVLVIVPSRGRPGRARDCVEALRAHSVRSDIVLGLDEDDPGLAAYLGIPGVRHAVSPRLGMNGTLNALAWAHCGAYRFLAFLGDDHRVGTAGWDDALASAIAGLAGGVAYGNDLLRGEELPTAVLLSSAIVQSLTYMAPPALRHLYLDDFWKDLGTELGALRYRDDVIVEHMHYAAGKAEVDDQYLEVNSQEMYDRERARYERYRRDRFPLDVELVRAGGRRLPRRERPPRAAVAG